MTDRIEERIYKSLWHILIAGIGFYELRNHKTTVSKVLAIGLIAFHIDGAFADITDTQPLSRRVLERIAGETHERKPTGNFFQITDIRLQ